MMDMREAVEEASDSQALKQIESQVEQMSIWLFASIVFHQPL